MSQHTKKMITECALRLAEKKPINKITVREITAECELTRNTFYYHYHDIYDVFKSYIDDRIDEISKQASDSAESAIFSFIEMFSRYRKVFLNLYKSLGHEEFSKFSYKKIHNLILMSIEKEYDTSVFSKLDLEIICVFYEEAIFGIMVRWLQDKRFDSPDEIRMYLDRTKVLFYGQIKHLIDNCLLP